jgi:hypothetical protein
MTVDELELNAAKRDLKPGEFICIDAEVPMMVTERLGSANGVEYSAFTPKMPMAIK